VSMEVEEKAPAAMAALTPATTNSTVTHAR